ncbi:MAG: hypothetical protein FVQ81_10240 [Candidatus Glassbacteria bacterium]|nr:hypothetical protein [Candidatus Glassbacteria bacterium]
MIMEPEEQGKFEPPEHPVDRLTGRFKKTVLAVAVAELVIYWLLVIRFPAAMLPVSVLLGGAAWFFRRADNYLSSLQQEMRLSQRDLDFVAKYCKSWIYISAYGAAFALFLLLRG